MLKEIRKYHDNIYQIYYKDANGNIQGAVKGFCENGDIYAVGVKKNNLWHNIYIQYCEYNIIEYIDTCKQNLRNGIYIKFNQK